MYFKSFLALIVIFSLVGFILPYLVSSKDGIMNGIGIFVIVATFGGVAVWMDNKKKEREKDE